MWDVSISAGLVFAIILRIFATTYGRVKSIKGCNESVWILVASPAQHLGQVFYDLLRNRIQIEIVERAL